MNKLLFLVLAFISFMAGFAKDYPDEYYTLRDDMYNFAKEPEELEKDYDICVAHAKETLTGYDLNLALSRYEFVIGRAYSYHEKKAEAAKHFDMGMEYGELALKEKTTALSQLIYIENICGNCGVKSLGWMIAWGPKVAPGARKVLKMDAKNGAAWYNINAQSVYAPKAFANYKKGVKEMTALLDNPNVILDKDDEFNVKSAIGYAYLQLDNFKDAKIWLDKSLEIYPGNKFVLKLLENMEKGSKFTLFEEEQ